MCGLQAANYIEIPGRRSLVWEAVGMGQKLNLFSLLPIHHFCLPVPLYHPKLLHSKWPSGVPLCSVSRPLKLIVIIDPEKGSPKKPS